MAGPIRSLQLFHKNMKIAPPKKIIVKEKIEFQKALLQEDTKNQKSLRQGLVWFGFSLASQHFLSFR